MSNIQELFKTPIYKVKLNLDNKIMKDYCFDLHKKDKGRNISNQGGWQSNDLMGKHEPLMKMIQEITNHSNIFANNIELKTPVKIDNCWININGYRDFNREHNHPYSILSGVYYLNTPKNCGNIFFKHPCNDYFNYDWNNKSIVNKNEYTSPEWWLPSEQGNLYIFPSWLTHYVQPNLNKKEKRISFSFNITKI